MGKKVIYFKEKSKIDEGWINGGFFVFEPIIFKLIKNDNTFLEKEPLEALSKKKNWELLNIMIIGSVWILKEIN